MKKNILETIKFIVIALIIVLPIRMFIAQPFIVSGISMLPTFKDGDYLIVDEFSYNFLRKPERNEVVVFKYPTKNSDEKKRYLIKRIIGLPGEEVIINNGNVTIKNTENPDGLVLEQNYINEAFHTNATYKLENDEYFVMGDNRNYSSDSRVWGKLPGDMIEGRALVRLLPITNIDFLPGKIN